MTRFFISALALMGMGIMANAQEKVKVHNGAESYVTTIEYVTFDATDADEVVSVSDLQSANATLATDKSNLEAQVTTLTREKAELATAKTTLEGQVTTLTSEKAELATAKTTLEGQVTTLTSEKAELATAKTTLEGQVTTLTSEKAELATAKTALEGQVSTLTSEKESLESDLTKYKQKYLKLVTNGHDYVDLGLTSGTLWATCNVGADAPESYGDYYAWGEVETHYSAGGNTNNPTWKEGYSAGYEWSTYKWCNGSYNKQTKYCRSSSYGTVDNKIELDDADDVVVQTWGGAWKMPTYKQQTELRNECYWVWTTTYNGESVSGYIVYKAKNDSDKGVKVYSGSTPSADYDVASDAHIFLPAAGDRWDTGLSYVGGDGNYWSRSLYTNDSVNAYGLSFNSRNVGGYSNGRGRGFSVRPVCPGLQK